MTDELTDTGCRTIQDYYAMCAADSQRLRAELEHWIANHNEQLRKKRALHDRYTVALAELERERTQNRELRAAIALVRSIPVVTNDERHGYDCAGCGAPLGAEHGAGCPWDRAMVLVYQREGTA